MFSVIILGATLTTQMSRAESNSDYLRETGVDFQIGLLPKELNYLWQDKKGHRTTMVLKEGDARYNLLKEYLVIEQHSWNLLRSDVGYIGSGYFFTPTFKIICETDGKGTIIQYKASSKWTSMGKSGKTPCDAIRNVK